MTDIQRLALLRSVVARLGSAPHDEVRVVDRVLTRIELGRERRDRRATLRALELAITEAS